MSPPAQSSKPRSRTADRTVGPRRKAIAARPGRCQPGLVNDSGTTATDDFAVRVLNAALGAVELMSIHLGDRLGWYRALADGGPATAVELTGRAGGSPRYAREWL